MTLVKGAKISIVLYTGQSVEYAKNLGDSLDYKCTNNIELPVEGTTNNMIINKVIKNQYEDPCTSYITYTIKVEGEIV